MFILQKIPAKKIIFWTRMGEFYLSRTRESGTRLGPPVSNCVYFPKAWRDSEVIFIPKPGKDGSTPAEYMLLILLNTMGQLLEKGLNAN